MAWGESQGRGPRPTIDAYRMTRRRAAEAGFKQKLGRHVFRATGITAYLEAGGTLENAQAMAAHESPRTTSSTIARAMRSRSTRSSGSQFDPGTYRSKAPSMLSAIPRCRSVGRRSVAPRVPSAIASFQCGSGSVSATLPMNWFASRRRKFRDRHSKQRFADWYTGVIGARGSCRQCPYG